MASFYSLETQNLTVSFQVASTQNSEFIPNLAETIVENCNGEISDWEITEFDGEEDGDLIPDTTYAITILCFVDVSGYCDYDPGRTYGDPYDCYPGYIDDIEYEDGIIDNCDTTNVLEITPELADLSVVIGDISGDGEIELHED